MTAPIKLEKNITQAGVPSIGRIVSPPLRVIELARKAAVHGEDSFFFVKRGPASQAINPRTYQAQTLEENAPVSVTEYRFAPAARPKPGAPEAVGPAVVLDAARRLQDQGLPVVVCYTDRKAYLLQPAAAVGSAPPEPDLAALLGGLSLS